MEHADEAAAQTPGEVPFGLLIGLPTVIAWSLSFYRIGTPQLWYDEVATWWASQLAWSDLLSLLRHVDAVLAPYYVFMRGFTHVFGSSEAALRAPSAIAVGLCAGALAVLGARLFDRHVGLRAGLIFALLPAISRYGQEARPYALCCLFATLSTLLVLRLREPAPGARIIAAYVVSVAALGLSHLLSLSLLAAHAAYILNLSLTKPYVRFEAVPFRRFALSAATGAAFAAPLVALGSQQSAQLRIISVTPAWALSILKGQLTPARLGLVLMGIFLAYALFSRRQPGLLLVWAVGLPLIFLVTYPWLHLFRPRYFFFTLPAWALLAAWRVEQFAAARRHRFASTVVISLAILAVGFGWQEKMRGSMARVSADFRGAAAHLVEDALPGDGLVFGGSRKAANAHRLALLHELSDGPVLSDVLVTEPMHEIGRFHAVECKDPRPCLSRKVERLWFVTSEPPRRLYARTRAELVRVLKDQFVVKAVTQHSGITLTLLTRK